MRRILLAAVLVAVAAPASAETVIWTGEVHVEKWVTDDGSEFYGYWRGIFGNMPGVRQFEFDGRTYTVDLFYITNTPRSLLAGAERRGSPGILPTDRGLAWLVDGQRFEIADHDRSFPDRGVAAWDNSGLDWQDGQVVSLQLMQAATPVPALPVAGAVLLALVLLVRGWRRGFALWACRATLEVDPRRRGVPSLR